MTLPSGERKAMRNGVRDTLTFSESVDNVIASRDWSTFTADAFGKAPGKTAKD